MLLSREKGDACIKLTIDGESIKSSSDLKLLGVTIDDKLNFSIHISNVCNKATKKVSVLVRMRNMIPFQAKLQLYKSIILSNLTYCHVVWHFCSASDNRKLERVQERALRAIFNDRSTNYEALLNKKAKLSSLQNRRLQDILILMYKIKNSLAPLQLCNLFHYQNNSYNLRSDFTVPRFTTTKYGKHSFRYLGPYLWGRVGHEIRSKSNLQAFMRRTLDVSGRCMWLLRMLFIAVFWQSGLCAVPVVVGASGVCTVYYFTV